MKRILVLSLALGALVCGASSAAAQSLQPPFDADYSLLSLGSVPSLPANYGGLCFLDDNTILIGGAANGAAGAIYSVGVVRNAQSHIIGFSGAAQLYATAPNIDGGLAFGPGGVLFFTTYSNNLLGQIKPGSSAPDKFIDLGPLGIQSSVGTLVFGPYGFRIASYSGSQFYSADLVADGSGTYDLTNVVERANTGGGPEGIIYVPAGSADFPNPSVLISEWGAGFVRAYEIDANGNPIAATRRDFIAGLSGAEGAVLDPVTNDFLFSTFGGGNQIVRVSGFAAVPEPATFALGAAGFAGACFARSRSRAKKKAKAEKKKEAPVA